MAAAATSNVIRDPADQFNSVPDEILAEVLGKLAQIDPDSLIALTVVCKRFNAVLTEYDDIWERACNTAGQWSSEVRQGRTHRQWFMHHVRGVRDWRGHAVGCRLAGHSSGVTALHIPVPREVYSYTQGPVAANTHTLVSAAAPPDNRILVWDTHSQSVTRTVSLPTPAARFSTVGFADNDRDIALVQECKLKVVDLFKGRVRGSCDTAATSTITCIHFCGMLIAIGGYDKCVRLYSATDARLVREYVDLAEVVWSVRVVPRTRSIFAGLRDGTVMELPLDSSSEFPAPRMLVGHQDSVMALRDVPSLGVVVSAGYDRVIRVWKDGQQSRAALEGHSDTIFALDELNTLVASGGRDSTVRIWDIYSGEAIACYDVSREDIKQLWFGHDRLWAASFDGVVYGFQPEQLRADEEVEGGEPPPMVFRRQNTLGRGECSVM